MFRIASFGLVLAAVAFLCRPAPAPAGPTVPYEDRVSGTATPTDGAGTFALDGTGVATYLGRFEMKGQDTLTVTSVDLGSGTASGTVTEGTFTLTAADGSTASGAFSGTFTVDLTTGMAVLVLSPLDVESGTGRLAGVSGAGTTTVILDTTTGHFTYTSVGTLTLP